MKKGRTLVLIGSLTLIIGGFLPWISAPNLFGVTGTSIEGIEAGWEGDGFLTSGIGLALLLGELFFGKPSRKWFGLTVTGLAALAAFVVFLDFRRILEIAPEAGFYAATDAGIYVTLLGAVLAMIGGLSNSVRTWTQLGAKVIGSTA